MRLHKLTEHLLQSGIDRDDILESTSTGWLGIDVPASVAERLFVTEYYESHGADGAVDVGCDKYHVPSHLSNHVDFITPGIGASSLHKRSRPVAPQLRALGDTLLDRSATNFTELPCGKVITPACIRALYDIPAANHYHQDNTLGVFEFTDVYDQKDLDLFFKYFAKDIPKGTHPKLDSINGATAPTNPQNGGSESIIDLTLAFSLIYPQNITLYQTGFTKKQAKHLLKEAHGSPGNKKEIAGGIAIVENLLNAVDGSFCTPAAKKQGLDCGTTDLTPVLSVSYGTPEINMPFKFAQRACNEYMKLGLKGHTLVFASGDYGPAGNAIPGGNVSAVSNACINLEDPQNGLLNGTVFNPTFPNTCPYVLSVGGTQLDGNETVEDKESVLHKRLDFPSYIDFGSSGGFSNYFREPRYQASAVGKYLVKYNPGYKTYEFPGGQKVGADGGIYAKGGRAFPGRVFLDM
jgi:tripeptidyl-peptidase-1